MQTKLRKDTNKTSPPYDLSSNYLKIRCSCRANHSFRVGWSFFFSIEHLNLNERVRAKTSILIWSLHKAAGVLAHLISDCEELPFCFGGQREKSIRYLLLAHLWARSDGRGFCLLLSREFIRYWCFIMDSNLSGCIYSCVWIFISLFGKGNRSDEFFINVSFFLSFLLLPDYINSSANTTRITTRYCVECIKVS